MLLLSRHFSTGIYGNDMDQHFFDALCLRSYVVESVKRKDTLTLPFYPQPNQHHQFFLLIHLQILYKHPIIVLKTKFESKVKMSSSLFC